MEVFKPITSNLNKYERKFVCSKRHKLDEYLVDNAEYLHEYIISQKYSGDIKYRKYQYTDEVGKLRVTCTKHTKNQKSGVLKQVNITEIDVAEYDSVSCVTEIVKSRKAYRLKNLSDVYLDVDIFTQNRDALLVEVWSENEESLNSFECFKGLLEVTGLKYYSNQYIASTSENIVSRPVIVLEGTDLIGKSTIAEILVKDGYLCMDRDQYDFSNYVDISKTPQQCVDDILKKYKDYNRVLVLLYVDKNSEYILKKRLKAREEVEPLSEYDNQCIEYNTLYRDIAEKLQSELNYTLVFNVAYLSASTISKKLESYTNKTWFNKVYIASKFKLQGEGTLASRLKEDIRSKLLGSSEKLVQNQGYLRIPSTRAVYTAPFYCEQASNGDYTSTDCDVVVREELKAVADSDTFIVYFDENYSCGSVVELIYAVMSNKNVLIIYKEESSVKYNTKSEHWFAITSAIQLSNKVEVKCVSSEDEVVPLIKEYLK